MTYKINFYIFYTILYYMTSRKLNFDEETKQFIAIYTNIKGEEIEKIFT